MLILQRKKGESIVVNGNIHISITEVGSDWVKLSIDAPKEVPILRTELLEAADANQEASAADSSSVYDLKNFFTEEL